MVDDPDNPGFVADGIIDCRLTICSAVYLHTLLKSRVGYDISTLLLVKRIDLYHTGRKPMVQAVLLSCVGVGMNESLNR
jgi:hypothetical protein